MKKTSKKTKPAVCPECGKRQSRAKANTVRHPQFKNKTLAQIAKESGIALSTLVFRIRSKPDITYRELIKPVSWSRKALRFKGKTLTEIANETGVPRSTLKVRASNNPNISYKELTRPSNK